MNNLVVIKVARQRFLYLLCALRKSQNRLVDGGGSYCTSRERESLSGVVCLCGAVHCGSALRCSGVAMVTSSDNQSWK